MAVGEAIFGKPFVTNDCGKEVYYYQLGMFTHKYFADPSFGHGFPWKTVNEGNRHLRPVRSQRLLVFEKSRWKTIMDEGKRRLATESNLAFLQNLGP